MGNYQQMGKLLKEHLGVTMDQAQKMDRNELDALVERAFDHEVDVAVDNDGECCKDGSDAAHVVDFLNNLYGEKYGE